MGWFIAAATAGLIAAAPAAIIDNNDHDVGDGSPELIDLSAERYSRYTVPVTIGGAGPYHFMIDTGAQATVLTRDLADTLGLHDRRPATLIAMASTREIEVTRIENFTVGNRIFDVETAPLAERVHIGGTDGILGLDSLQNQRVLIDFENHTIAVADADQPGGDKGYEIVVSARRKLGQLIITRARLNGIRTAVIVDTGAQGSFGNSILEKRLRSRSAGEATMTDVNGVSTSGDIKMARSLEIGRAQINNLPIAFADSPTFKALGLDKEPTLVLGMRELKLFKRVAIDFKNRKVLFDMPPAQWDDNPFSRRYSF